MQKVNYILKIRFNTDKLTSRAEKIKTLKNKMGHYILPVQDIHTVSTHREGKGFKNTLQLF